MLVSMMLPSMANAAVKDSLFVVKNGRIFSAYEIGKDIDNISFQKKQAAEPNTIKVGDETIEIKSAMAMGQNGLIYVFLSPTEGCKTMQDFGASKAYLQIAISPELMDENITFSKLASEHADGMFSVTYCDVEKYNNDDDYEPIMFSSDDYEDYFVDGTLNISRDGDKLMVDLTTEPIDGGLALGANYNGAFTLAQANSNYFTVDGEQKELRVVFAEQKADGITFYLTTGNITNAKDLESCHYYARLFVPTTNMDGNDIDVQGTKEYELELVDNVTDLQKTLYFNAATGVANNAKGYVSVLDRGDGSYTIIVDVEELGNRTTRDLKLYFKGTPLKYDLSEPNQYTVAGGKPVELKSAVVTHDLNAETYTIYISSKPGITTLEGMADADIVIVEPEDFVNDDQTHGFSGTETNAMLSITYAGDTYRQANCGNVDNAIAQGGSTKVNISGDKINLDVILFGMTKHKGSLKGHYEGNVTRL